MQLLWNFRSSNMQNKIILIEKADIFNLMVHTLKMNMRLHIIPFFTHLTTQKLKFIICIQRIKHFQSGYQLARSIYLCIYI